MKIDAYIEANKNNWAALTPFTARSQLASVPDPVTTSPQVMYDHLASRLAPYTRNIYWMRVAHYYAWAMPSKPNKFTQWAKQNRNLFKNAYKKEVLNVTFEEAEALIATISEDQVKRECFRMLYGGQRWGDTPDGHGGVIGKGSKVRPNYAPEFPRTTTCYTKVYRTLGRLGLKPHSLRKLALTKLAEKGATAADLMAVAGWSSIHTATSYLQPKQDKKLMEMIRGN